MATHKPMSAKHRRIILAHAEKCVRLQRRWFRLGTPAPSPEWNAVDAAENDLRYAIVMLAHRREPKPPRVEKAGKP
jgi:hypothetical protein